MGVNGLKQEVTKSDFTLGTFVDGCLSIADNPIPYPKWFHTPKFFQVFLTVHIYPFLHPVGERHGEFCLRT